MMTKSNDSTMKSNIAKDFILIALLILAMGITTSVSNNVYAQSQQAKVGTHYGFEISGGVQSYQLASNLADLDQVNIDQRGGSLGFIVGSDYWKAKINPIGFYTGNADSQVTTKLIQSEAQINFYPIKLFSNSTSRLPQVYILGGTSRGKNKINGSVLSTEEDPALCIYNTFSTSIVNWNITGGAGIEYQIGHGQEFITVFAEIKKGLSVGTSTDNVEFKNTTPNNITMVSIGFSIGINK